MAGRRPVVLVGGELKQLSDEDFLARVVTLLNEQSGPLTLSLSETLSAGSLDPARTNVNVSLSNSNLTATFVPGQAVSMGQPGKTDGKRYFEVTFVSGSNSSSCGVGVGSSTTPLNIELGYNGNAEAEVGVFQNSGNIYRDSGSLVGSAQAFSTAGATVCIAVDCDARLIWFRTNAGNWNGSATNNPTTGVGGLAITGTGPIFPGISTNTNAVFTSNFGNAAFSFTLPADYGPWGVVEDHGVVSPVDVALISPVEGQTLVYNGSQWTNITDPEYGENANGEFLRFRNGWQACTNGGAAITTDPAAFVGAVTSIDGDKLRIGRWY